MHTQTILSIQGVPPSEQPLAQEEIQKALFVGAETDEHPFSSELRNLVGRDSKLSNLDVSHEVKPNIPSDADSIDGFKSDVDAKLSHPESSEPDPLAELPPRDNQISTNETAKSQPKQTELLLKQAIDTGLETTAVGYDGRENAAEPVITAPTTPVLATSKSQVSLQSEFGTRAQRDNQLLTASKGRLHEQNNPNDVQVSISSQTSISAKTSSEVAPQITAAQQSQIAKVQTTRAAIEAPGDLPSGEVREQPSHFNQNHDPKTASPHVDALQKNLVPPKVQFSTENTPGMEGRSVKPTEVFFDRHAAASGDQKANSPTEIAGSNLKATRSMLSAPQFEAHQTLARQPVIAQALLADPIVPEFPRAQIAVSAASQSIGNSAPESPDSANGHLQTVWGRPARQPVVTQAVIADPIVPEFPRDQIAASAGSHPIRNSAPQGPVSSTSQLQTAWGTPARQIADFAVLSSNQQTELFLSPNELGKVRISLQTVEQSVVVQISAEKQETADLLRRNIADLAQEFAELGYENIDFSFSKRGESQTNINKGDDDETVLAADSTKLTPSEQIRSQNIAILSAESLDIRL